MLSLRHRTQQGIAKGQIRPFPSLVNIKCVCLTAQFLTAQFPGVFPSTPPFFS